MNRPRLAIGLARRSTLVGVVAFCALVGLSGCGDSDPAAPETAATTAPGVPAPSGARAIEVGEVVYGRISSGDPECRFSAVHGGWSGLCSAFLLSAPAGGLLSTTVEWAADAPLTLFMKTSSGEQIDLTCCDSPVVMQLPADSGATYRMELAYAGRPVGYPNIQRVDYTLETALLPYEAQTLRTTRVIVLADEARTQRLASARLEVVEGPSAGTVARFDDASGVYELTGLDAGFVRVLASANGFLPSTVRWPVGTNLERELVLQRSELLLDATHSLSGITWADSSGRRGWTGVRVEILDGPLAGVFTFSDEFLGLYFLAGLPPGLTRVRASAEWVHPQTTSVRVAGNTDLPFILPARCGAWQVPVGWPCAP